MAVVSLLTSMTAADVGYCDGLVHVLTESVGQWLEVVEVAVVCTIAECSDNCRFAKMTDY